MGNTMKLPKIVILLTSSLLLPAAVSISNAGKTLAPVYQLLLHGEKAAELSDIQKKFIRLSGYPQVVTKSFSVENGKKRIDEVWSYVPLGVMEIFINGAFVEEKSLDTSGPADASIVYKPQDFSTSLTEQQVLARYGSPDETKHETVWNGTLDFYIYNNLYLSFNNDELVSVTYATGYQPVTGGGPR